VTARNDSRVKGESKYEHFKRLLKTAVTFPADWAAGNVHHKIGSVWMTMNNIPNGIHVYDVIEFGGALFAAIATVMGGMVARSTTAATPGSDADQALPYSRTRTFFVLDDDTGPRLYAATNGGRIYRFDGRSDFAEMNVRFFPAISDLKDVFVARPPSTGSRSSTSPARRSSTTTGDTGIVRRGARGLRRPLPLPGGALARDLLVHDDVLYALASTQPSAQSTRVHVFATRDLESFAEVCFFDAETFARSFETLNGDFYFGLGWIRIISRARPAAS